MVESEVRVVDTAQLWYGTLRPATDEGLSLNSLHMKEIVPDTCSLVWSSVYVCVEMGRYCSTVWWGGDTISTEKCLLTWYYVQSATTCSLNISNSIKLSLHKFNHQSIYIFFSWHRHSPITSKTCSRSVTCAALQQSGGCCRRVGTWKGLPPSHPHESARAVKGLFQILWHH